MGYGAQDSRLKMTKAEEDQYSALPWDAGIAYLHELEVAKGLRTPDPMNPSVLHEVDPASIPQPTVFTKTLKVNGVEKTFTASTELEAERQAGEFLEQTFAHGGEQPTARNSRGQFTKPAAASKDLSQATNETLTQEDANELMRRLRLEQDWRVGALSSEDFLEQSGALDRYFQSQGIDPETLKAQSQEARANVAETQSWAQATEEFLHSEQGADWPGGDSEIISTIIANEGWIDNPNKFETIVNACAVYRELLARQSGLAGANSRAEIDSLLGRTNRPTGQSVWGSR